MIPEPGGFLLPIAEAMTLKADQTLDIARALQTLRPKASGPMVVSGGVVRDAPNGETLAGVQVAAKVGKSARRFPRVAGLTPGQVRWLPAGTAIGTRVWTGADWRRVSKTSISGGATPRLGR